MDIVKFEGFEDYNPNEIDDEIYLSEAPLALIMGNIRTQFENPGENRKNDFVQVFLNKYIYSKKIELEEEEEKLDDLHVEFISFIENILHEYLSIGLPEIEDKEDCIQEELIQYVYRFFIINIKKNFVKFCINYIKKNKEALASMIELKKDVAYLSYKNSIEDEDILVILTNISQVIQNIFNEDIDPITFLNNCKREDGSDLEIDFMLSKYETMEVNGDFVENYFNMLDDDLLIEIECKVKNKLLKEYIIQ